MEDLCQPAKTNLENPDRRPKNCMCLNRNTNSSQLGGGGEAHNTYHTIRVIKQ